MSVGVKIGSKPAPITNSDPESVWSIVVDPLNLRKCEFEKQTKWSQFGQIRNFDTSDKRKNSQDKNIYSFCAQIFICVSDEDLKKKND